MIEMLIQSQMTMVLWFLRCLRITLWPKMTSFSTRHQKTCPTCQMRVGFTWHFDSVSWCFCAWVTRQFLESCVCVQFVSWSPSWKVCFTSPLHFQKTFRRVCVLLCLPCCDCVWSHTKHVFVGLKINSVQKHHCHHHCYAWFMRWQSWWMPFKPLRLFRVVSSHALSTMHRLKRADDKKKQKTLTQTFSSSFSWHWHASWWESDFEHSPQEWYDR